MSKNHLIKKGCSNQTKIFWDFQKYFSGFPVHGSCNVCMYKKVACTCIWACFNVPMRAYLLA